MTVLKRAVLVALTIGAVEARGQMNRREPHIGYLYPAGGQQDTVFRITIGGQFLRGADRVYISGAGIRASVIKHYPPIRNLNRQQRDELVRRLRSAIEQRWSELAADGLVDPTPPWQRLALGRPRRPATAKKDSPDEPEPVKLPDHPLLNDLEDRSLRELLHVRDALLHYRKRQANTQIAETVVIEVTVERAAEPGDHELRLGTRLGLTNPMVLQVGALPEVRELEPNGPRQFDFLPPEPPLEPPILINGQVMPGDIDRFRFRAQQGQQLVIEACARRLIPFLADAVPGWFQATLALYDERGREVAYADDYGFDPDPVLFFEVPQDGVYELAIRDSIYRGRQDFVYRVSVAQRPFITSVFPLGSRAGQDRLVAIDGWNLPTQRMLLEAKSETEGIRQKVWGRGKRSSNPVLYAIDPLRTSSEDECNDTIAEAPRIVLPRIVNGRIDPPGDVDVFRFRGKAGNDVVVEVVARRLHSLLDSLVRLTDETGRVLAWNDDCEHKEGFLHTDMGVLTHHADSYLRASLPADGIYYVHISDAQAHGGAAYGYRLRVGPPQPDFAVCVTPSTINAFSGRAVPIHVHLLRKDGFAGAIELALKDAPDGFRLSGPRVPPGRDHVRMTLTPPRTGLDEPVVLQLEARARIDGQLVSRPVVPAENVMQAFLYRHLVPSQELMVTVRGGRRAPPPVELVGAGPIRLRVGSTAVVRFKTPGRPKLPDIALELRDPPDGVSLHDVTVVPGGLKFVLKADRATAQRGLADNLIVEAFMDVERPQQDGAGVNKQRVPIGFLPAIPIEVARW